MALRRPCFSHCSWNKTHYTPQLCTPTVLNVRFSSKTYDVTDFRKVRQLEHQQEHQDYNSLTQQQQQLRKTKKQIPNNPPPASIHARRQHRKHTPWRPRIRLTRQAMSRLRTLHKTDPHYFTYSRLSEMFGISVTAVNKILKSKFMDDKQ